MNFSKIAQVIILWDFMGGERLVAVIFPSLVSV